MTNNNPIIIMTPLITATAIVAVVISGFSIGRVGNPNQIGQVENPLSLYPNIETIGVTLNGANLPKTAGLMHRQTGETNWHAGHPLVRIDDGIYREAVTFPSSGTESNWIQVKAEGSAAILDGSETLTGKIWRPHSKARVWFVKIGSLIGYLARDQIRFYKYDDLSGLLQSRGHGKVSINEGWYFEPKTLRLYIRSLDDPSGHSWQLPHLNHAFDANGRDWLWIEGFEMQFSARERMAVAYVHSTLLM